MKNNTMKITFNDALLITQFGMPDRQETVDRIATVCPALADDALRRDAFILKEQIGNIPDFVWPEFFRQLKLNMENCICLDRLAWDNDNNLEDDEEFNED